MQNILSSIKSILLNCPISIIHEFHRPPYGGGNQFLLALERSIKETGIQVSRNIVNKSTKVCLFNSFNFDFHRLRQFKNKFPSLRMIHRVDGPIQTYRGRDDGTDLRINTINLEMANATIFQSNYSLQKHKELNLKFVNPIVIYNSVDSIVFNKNNRIAMPNGTRKTRLIAVSWSDNPNKGGAIYKWLEENLDWSKYEFTFVGRTSTPLCRAKQISPCHSQRLAGILRQHDIYITASQNDPCSNALLEALSCGLPAVYLNSGGHPELVKSAGEKFNSINDLLTAINTVNASIEKYQSQITIATMTEIAKKYLEVAFTKWT